MAEHRNENDADSPWHAIPPRTTPTWEIELLLSGAVVFALLQLPEPLRVFFRQLMARFDEPLSIPILLVMVYALIVIYALIGTFIVHLSVRAYWVALVGLHSVYPGGVRWDRVRQGPIAVAAARTKLRSLPDAIERADNLASLGFAFGLMIALSGLMGAMVALPLFALSAFASVLLFEGEHLMNLFMVPMLGLGALALGFALVDRSIGRRLMVDGEPQGRLARLIFGFHRRMPNATSNALLLPLASNAPPGRTYLLFTIALAAVAALPMLQEIDHRGELAPNHYHYLPWHPRGLQIQPDHYADMRSASSPPQLPWIESERVSGPLLRVFVPYRPERFNRSMEHACPGVGPALRQALESKQDTEREPASRLALDCLSGLLDVRIDGLPAAGHWLPAEDPVSGVRGLGTQLLLDGLEPGLHELTVAPIGRGAPGSARHARSLEAGPWRIPFWLAAAVSSPETKKAGRSPPVPEP